MNELKATKEDKGLKEKRVSEKGNWRAPSIPLLEGTQPGDIQERQEGRKKIEHASGIASGSNGSKTKVEVEARRLLGAECYRPGL